MGEVWEYLLYYKCSNVFKKWDPFAEYWSMLYTCNGMKSPELRGNAHALKTEICVFTARKNAH